MDSCDASSERARLSDVSEGGGRSRVELRSSLSYPLKLTEREERLVEFPLCLWTTFRLIYIQEEPRTQSVKMVTINTMSISTRLPESIRGVHNAIMYSQHFLKWGPFHIYLPSPFSSPLPLFLPLSDLGSACCSLHRPYLFNFISTLPPPPPPPRRPPEHHLICTESP